MDQTAAAGSVTVTSNAVPVALAPKLVSNAQLKAKLAENGATALTVNCSPPVLPQQTIALIVGSQLVSSAPVQAATSQLSFGLQGFTAGTYLLRLRIDSVDSIPVASAARTGEREPAGADAVRPQPATGPVVTAQPADVVSDVDAWEAMNSAYLAAGLAWTRERLGAGREDQDATPWWEAGAEAEPAAALELLGDRLGLSRFERLVLMLAAATELDPSIAARCAEANGNPLAGYPTLALALAVLPGATWDVVSPQRPLRYWRLIELDEPRAGALTATRIRIDERIVSFLKGLNVMDERLAPVVSPGGRRTSAEPAGHPRASRGRDHRGADRGGKRRAPAGDRARRSGSRRAARPRVPARRSASAVSSTRSRPSGCPRARWSCAT